MVKMGKIIIYSYKSLVHFSIILMDLIVKFTDWYNKSIFDRFTITNEWRLHINNIQQNKILYLIEINRKPFLTITTCLLWQGCLEFEGMWSSFYCILNITNVLSFGSSYKRKIMNWEFKEDNDNLETGKYSFFFFVNE